MRARQGNAGGRAGQLDSRYTFARPHAHVPHRMERTVGRERTLPPRDLYASQRALPHIEHSAYILICEDSASITMSPDVGLSGRGAGIILYVD